MDYPSRLLINGRSANQCFDDEEKLYIRFSSVEPSTGKPSGTDLHPPDQSVNRGLYSEPEDVLLARYPKFVNHGYGYLLVKDVPKGILSGDEVPFDFYPFHNPVGPPDEPLENYSHTTLLMNAADGRNKPPTKVKREFKQRIADMVQKLRDPIEDQE